MNAATKRVRTTATAPRRHHHPSACTSPTDAPIDANWEGCAVLFTWYLREATIASR